MDGWKIVMIIGIVILAICLMGFLYIMVIAKSDGKVSDPVYGEIAIIAKQAGDILLALKKQDRTAVCRVSRGILGIQVEVASSGEPPVHYNREIRMEGRAEEEIRQFVAYTAQNVAHFTKNSYTAVQEYGDSFRIERNAFYRPAKPQ